MLCRERELIRLEPPGFLIIIITELKGVIQDFLTLSSLRHKLSPICTLKGTVRYRVQITCNTSSDYHVQHVMCEVVRRDSSAIKADRVEIAFIIALFYWLKPLTNEEGEETRVPRENP